MLDQTKGPQTVESVRTKREGPSCHAIALWAPLKPVTTSTVLMLQSEKLRRAPRDTCKSSLEHVSLEWSWDYGLQRVTISLVSLERSTKPTCPSALGFLPMFAGSGPSVTQGLQKISVLLIPDSPF